MPDKKVDDDSIEKDSTVNDSKQSDLHTKDYAKHYKSGGHYVGKLFWGLLLILIGGLLLAKNLGLVSVSLSNIWNLWPLIIVGAGLSVLSFRNVIWRIFVTVCIFAMLALIAWVAIGSPSISSPVVSKEITIQKSSDNVKQADVSVTSGANTLKIDTVDQTAIAKAKLESNIATLTDLSVENGTTQQITLNMQTNNNWLNGSIRSSLTVDLARNLPISLNVNVGASDTDIDMTNAQLRNIDIDAGASDISIKFGSLESNIGISIDAGASSIVLKIPKDSGVRLNLDGGMTTNSLADLNLVSDGVYESSNYSKSTKKVDIKCQIGVSSFKIERY